MPRVKLIRDSNSKHLEPLLEVEEVAILQLKRYYKKVEKPKEEQERGK